MPDRPRIRTLALAATSFAIAACTTPASPREARAASVPVVITAAPAPASIPATAPATAPVAASQADPAAIAAIAAILDAVPGIGPAELETRLGTPAAPALLDVRTPEEYAAGHVPGARNLPHDQLARRLGELAADRDREVVVYCRTGRRAASAIETLRAAGFTGILHLRGDFQGWSAGGHPVATPAAVATAP